jgi:hypothetical protein
MNELRDFENDLRAALRQAEQAVREPQDLAERLIRRTTQRRTSRWRQLSVDVPRSVRRRVRPRRNRALIPLAAAAAVVAVITGVAVAVSLPGPGNRRPGGTSPLAPGVPRFYVEVANAMQVQVYDTATGHVVAAIQAPKGTHLDGQVVALAGDRTFLIAATPGSLTTDLWPCISLLYKFQLNEEGQPSPLRRLPITVPGWLSAPNNLSVTPDGRMIAFSSDLGCRPPSGSPLEMGVINLATGQMRFWTLRELYGSDVIYSIALSADGRQLAFSQGTFAQPDPNTIVARILPTNAPPGSVDQRSAVIPGTAQWGWVALSADGGLLYGCSTPFGANGAVTYYSESISGGQPQVIASWPPEGEESSLCAASPDPSGRYLLIQRPKVSRAPASRVSRPPNYPLVPQFNEQLRLVLMDLRTGQLRNLPPAGPPRNQFVGRPGIAW